MAPARRALQPPPRRFGRLDSRALRHMHCSHERIEIVAANSSQPLLSVYVSSETASRQEHAPKEERAGRAPGVGAAASAAKEEGAVARRRQAHRKKRLPRSKARNSVLQRRSAANTTNVSKRSRQTATRTAHQGRPRCETLQASAAPSTAHALRRDDARSSRAPANQAHSVRSAAPCAARKGTPSAGGKQTTKSTSYVELALALSSR